MISKNINANEKEIEQLKENYNFGSYAYEIPLDDFINCQCRYCTKKCIHENAFRRMPSKIGGLGLCENLK